MKHTLIRISAILTLQSLYAVNLDWDNEAVMNVGWHTASNWSGDRLPGSIASHHVFLDGAVDTPYVVQDHDPVNVFNLSIINDATLTIQADLLNVGSFDLGSDANGNRGIVDHSAGVVSSVLLSVGSSAAATSNSSYTLSDDAQLSATDLSVNRGIFSVSGDEATVTIGDSLTVSGMLSMELGQLGMNSIHVDGALIIDPSTAMLRVDLSSYIGGSRTIELIRFGSMSGSFDPDNVSFEGLRRGESASISYDADSINLILTSAPHSASNFWFVQKSWDGVSAGTANNLFLNNGRSLLDLDVQGLSYTQSSDGDDLLYTITWTGNDYDGDLINDVLSFDIRVEGFTGSTYTYSSTAGASSMSQLGSSAGVTTLQAEEGDLEIIWGVGGDNDADAGESLRFSVENLSVSSAGYLVEFDGFSEITLAESNGGNTHRLIIGEGTGLDSVDFDADSQGVALDYTDTAVVTGAGSFYSDEREWAVSAISYKLRVYHPDDVDAVGADLTDYSSVVTGPIFGDAYPEQADSTHFPAFSWDTVPRWLIVRKNTAYTDAEVLSMATNYDLIVWEKANSAGFSNTNEGTRDVAARIRAINPEVKNIYYFNSYIHYGAGESDAEYDENIWEWSNRIVDGDGAESVFLFKDLYYTHNYAIPELRDWWVKSVLSMTANTMIDGVLVDKVTEKNRSAYDAGGQPVSDYMTMLDALSQGLQAQGKLFIGNTLRNERNYAGRAHMELQDGSYLERWELANRDSVPTQTEAEARVTSIQLMREALSKGKMVFMISEGPDTSEAELAAALDYRLAIFLIIAETNAYFNFRGSVDATKDDWVWDTSWLPEFSHPLGPPLGPPVKDGTIYTRSFEHVDVWVNVETEQAQLIWKYSADEEILGQDNFDGSERYLSRTFSSTENSATATWDIVNRATVANPDILDTSLYLQNGDAGDSIDEIGYLESSKTDNFLGIERSAGKTLTYTFDISGYGDLHMTMDWVASDNYLSTLLVTASIDGSAAQDIFSVAKNTTNPSYTMEDGRTVSKNNGAQGYVNGVADALILDGFSTFNSTIEGTGSLLTIVIQQTGSYSGELGMDDLVLYGTSQTAYAPWIAGYGLSESDALETANPDGDAHSNLEEYAFGGDPLSAADGGHPMSHSMLIEGGISYFEFVYPRRTTPGSNLLYLLEITTDLTADDWQDAGAVELSPQSLDGDFEAITNRIDISGESAQFIRVRVETK
ncbi:MULTISPECIES: putative glycoside hydrolase [unclassified Lentimonas]|uniref:putative glycoside hydrolase n=1 Tax=unclassified Lentimonas TaxID=2630993 RepID=UPI00132B0026|nr:MULTISPECIES: putative glycoside hydrolase [unclassified Lentimonas]CAA6677721.1 Unannotated [Lentimonas sp. CC4]CAA6684984.1 Unannotated [Lentimonas sp. CC6]CAA7077900.1 Unannotated [Lentimonas sp. CC4]CAA7169825.1 Unannotated [Lentimonas sp. CC21]CAA7179944.1 Unannotated [Lentimonas sp. CC8]